jgi:hypothetical protein
LCIENLPRLNGVTVFRSKALRSGVHIIRVVSKSSSPVVVDAFRVYGGYPASPPKVEAQAEKAA